MKKLFLIFFAFIWTLTFSCDCDWYGPFLNNLEVENRIVKGKIIDHFYYTKDQKRFTDYQEFLDHVDSNYFTGYYDVSKSIQVEVLELLNGKEKRKLIEIFDTNGGDCLETIKNFKVGDIYIFHLYHFRNSDRLLNEKKGAYGLDNCFVSFLLYNERTNSVKGKIEVEEIDSINYELFKQKIKARLKKSND